MNKDKALFISFCIEQYANAKSISTNDVATLFEQYDITEYLYECYDVLHTQGHNWLIEDIDEMINNSIFGFCKDGQKAQCLLSARPR